MAIRKPDHLILQVNYLQAHRQAAGMKQWYVADKLGVALNTVHRWEYSIIGPPMAYLPSIAKLYGCSVDDLYRPPKEVDE